MGRRLVATLLYHNNLMKKSKPYLQNFFTFNNGIKPSIISSVIEDIVDDYFDKPKIFISFNTKEESYSDLSIDDFEELLEDNFNIADTGSFNITKEDNSFSLVLQFHNDNIGPNGNYTISLDDKDTNKDIEKFIWSKLKLEKYRMTPQLKSNQMIVDPIFVGRDYKIEPKLCFVLMPFSEKWSDRIWRHIEEIVLSNGFICKRADNLYGNNILTDIWSAINCAEIIVADITSRNPNVFYEIGIAHTVGKKVILLSQSKSDIPFDFLHYRHIIYEDNTDGIQYLIEELPNYLI